ncbi:fatty acid synthase [Caerostris extrusa]|uniref:Fatty acid synthase n=1 Tax=Caerostris extrusa TaxID=172846 RepID=A0AAV4M6R5_CAEEX|nr:fatty acid synthase [Caerostris extrusa]
MDISGHFEITEGKSVVAAGEVRLLENPVFNEISLQINEDSNALSSKIIYDELRIVGFEVGPAFQGLSKVDVEGTSGLVLWQDKWIPFLESLLLFFGVTTKDNEICLMSEVASLKIDPHLLRRAVSENVSSLTLPVNYKKHIRKCCSIGIELSNAHLDHVVHQEITDEPVLSNTSLSSMKSVTLHLNS